MTGEKREFLFPTKARENLLVEFIDAAAEYAQNDDLTPFDAISYLCMDTYGLGSGLIASR